MVTRVSIVTRYAGSSLARNGVEYGITIYNSLMFPKLRPWLLYLPLTTFPLGMARVASGMASVVELVETGRSGIFGGVQFRLSPSTGEGTLTYLCRNALVGSRDINSILVRYQLVSVPAP